MTTYFVGAELENFQISGLPYVGGDGGYNIDGGRGTIRMNGTSSWLDCAFLDPATGQSTALTTFWAHFTYAVDQAQSGLSIAEFRDATGQAWVKLAGYDGRGCGLQYWDATKAAWVEYASGFRQDTGGFTSRHYDIQITIGTQGRVRFFQESNLIQDFQVDTSAFQPITTMRLTPANYGYNAWFGSVIVASYNTIGHRVRRLNPIGNVNLGTWTNDYTAIDDSIDANPDSDFMTTTANDDIALFSVGTPLDTSPSLIVKAVAIGVRGRHDDAGPQNLATLINLSNVTYESPNLKNAGMSYVGNNTIYDVSPATNVAWTMAEVNACEFGFKTKA